MRNQQIGFVFQSFQLLHARERAEERRAAARVSRRAARASATARAPKALDAGRARRIACTTSRSSCRAASGSARRSRARSSASRRCCCATSRPATSTRATTEDIMALFHALHAEGNTILIVTHEPASRRAARGRSGSSTARSSATSGGRRHRRGGACCVAARGVLGAAGAAPHSAPAEAVRTAKVAQARSRRPRAADRRADGGERDRHAACRARIRGSSRSAGSPRTARSSRPATASLEFDNSAFTKQLEEKKLALLEAEMTLRSTRGARSRSTPRASRPSSTRRRSRSRRRR